MSSRRGSVNLARLDLVSIRLVVLCAEAGSLSKAAVRANISLTGASHRLCRIEQALGKRLFVRNYKGLAITDAGKVTVDHGYELLSTIERLTSKLLQSAD